MAEDSKNGGTNFLYFIVGGIVVVVALLAFLYMGGHLPGQTSKVNVTVEAPKVNP
jgi:TM2 domain-containing membrane protein YozV